MKHIHFIVNPISGNGKHELTLDYIKGFFDEEHYAVSLAYSERKKHAVSLTKEAIIAGKDIIVACGGDGTIHEVASALVGTAISFGIVPVGSGNGLASNLSISKTISGALKQLSQGREILMDVGSVNGKYFFSNMGFGIDATIINNYEKSGERKLGSYIRAALNSSQEYVAKRMLIRYDGKEIAVNPLLLFVSNSNEMGYTMSLTPRASLTDGKLDCLVVPRISLLKQLTFGLYVLLKKVEKFRKIIYVQTSHLEVEILESEKNGLQMDGEYFEVEESVFKIEVLPQALRVIC